MIVVSNTSPVINLAVIGKLDLLRLLYQKIMMPYAVFHEITVKGAGQPGASDVQAANWIERRQVNDPTLVTALRTELDPGEAEAIALALELNAELLLIDERLGRKVASRFGLNFIGLLGLLIDAKHKGFIAAVKPILDDLIIKAGFRVSQHLRTQILQTTGE